MVIGGEGLRWEGGCGVVNVGEGENVIEVVL